jgi:predicted Zn finger-like uncharacterized protein
MASGADKYRPSLSSGLPESVAGMAAQYKTQCPHCGAQFRISEQHLAQAKGAVRCGSCLKVFQATDHLIAEKPAAKTPAPAAKATPKPASRPAAAQKPATDNKWTMPEDNARPAPAEAPAGNRWTLDDELSDDMEDAVPSKLVDEPEPGITGAKRLLHVAGH